MKFMLMMHSTQSGCASMGSWQPQEVETHIRFMLRLVEELKATGELVMAEGLDFPGSTKIVRAERVDQPLVSEGPFVETKEFLAGFWIVEVPSLDRAIAIAAKASTAPGQRGLPMRIPIEIRQVMSAPPIDP